jgi:glycosyltransferase involved in cell wall biosynthesis
LEIIHLVLGKANPDRMSEVNKVVHQLATRQAASGQSVSVWGITKDLSENYGERKFETKLFKASNNPFSVPLNLNTALQEKKGKAVVHIHGGWIPVFASISAKLKTIGIPFVFTPHGAYNVVAMQRSRLLKNLYFNYFEKKLLQNATKIHCLDVSEMKGLHSLFKTEKSVLLPYGFEKEGFDFEPDPFGDRKFIIGFVGRLDGYSKGLDLLVDAFEDFHIDQPDSILWIVGDGSEKVKFERQIVSKGLQNHVKFWGSRFGIEKENILTQMDVFAHPSRYVGLPSSILEAAAFGLPVLVTEATNLGDFVRQYDCGKVVQDNDANAISNAMKDLFFQWKQGKCMAMGERAKLMVQTEFNWNSILKRFEQLYTNL